MSGAARCLSLRTQISLATSSLRPTTLTPQSTLTPIRQTIEASFKVA